MKCLYATRLACTALAVLVISSPAHAIFRAYLASDGSDANPCTLQQPCRLLPAALAAVDAGGEIWMLDSANFNTGQVEIVKSVSILAIPGALGSIVATGGGNGLNIATAGIKVSLRNLVVVQLGSGNYGVSYTNGTELAIAQCELANHPGSGGALYADAPGGRLSIKDTLIRDANKGVSLAGSVVATLDRVRVENATTGIAVAAPARVSLNEGALLGNGQGLSAVGVGDTALAAQATISRSAISGNQVGVFLQSTAAPGKAHVTMTQSVVSYNSGAGIGLYQGTVGAYTALSLDGNVITHNQAGVMITSGTPTIFSRANNLLKQNMEGDLMPATSPWSGQ